MLRSVLTSVVALSLAGALAAQAAEKREVENLFRVQVPAGWQDQTAPVPAMKMLVTSPRVKETGGNCNVISIEMPELQGADQATLDAAGAQVFTSEFWQKEFSDANMQNAKIEKSGARTQHGRQVFFVRASSDLTSQGTTVNVTQLQDVQLVSGLMFMVTCGARTAGVAREEGDFSTIMTSFEPIASTPTAMMQPNERPSLTLYQQPQFSGVSRVVTQDATDLASFGWSKPAASFSITGASAWQVCDGANFTGQCRTLSGSSPSLAAFTAASVRRLAARPGDLAAVGNTLRAAAKAALAASSTR